MSEEVLGLKNVSKCFPGRRAEAGVLSAVGVGRRKRGVAQDAVTALNDVSFAIRSGEAVAVLGRNGAGKSTLLQIIAGTMRPTRGEVKRVGRLSAMLELGFGFNPDFSGRENIALAASIFGISRKELKQVQPQIEAFSEIGEYLDRPIRTYSTGMVVRLAFAIITVSRPQVLIIDEALSVGDVFFQSKCVRWMEEYLAGGGTLLCATHDFHLIQKLCQRSLVLHRGELVYDGDVSGGIKCFYRLERGETLEDEEDKGAEAALVTLSEETAGDDVTEGWEKLTLRKDGRTGDRRMELVSVESAPLLSGSIGTGEWVQVRLTVKANEELESFDFGLGFRDRTGQLIGGFHSYYDGRPCGRVEEGDVVTIEFSLQLHLKPQEYLLIIGLAINHSAHDWEDLDCYWDCAAVTIVGRDQFWGMAKLPFGQIKVSRRTVAITEGVS